MAKPRDRVQLLKQEFVSRGGDASDEVLDFPENNPVEPNEDALEAQGLFLQPPIPDLEVPVTDEDVYLSRDAVGNMCFKDANTSEVSLSQLASASSGLLPLESLLYTEDLCIIVVGCDFVEKP